MIYAATDGSAGGLGVLVAVVIGLIAIGAAMWFLGDRNKHGKSAPPHTATAQPRDGTAGGAGALQPGRRRLPDIDTLDYVAVAQPKRRRSSRRTAACRRCQ